MLASIALRRPTLSGKTMCETPTTQIDLAPTSDGPVESITVHPGARKTIIASKPQEYLLGIPP
ncbi:hypothetical protein [Sphingomonas sp. PAMC 26605]|uniref:hypothetical protein n=1 Tax=Sphingomonas sp. PAMC 26605 TaxID=1112214 RepID=UPI0012F51944|nr:hypothetical protein [Sphingomonas sp. PAMC 26605]